MKKLSGYAKSKTTVSISIGIDLFMQLEDLRMSESLMSPPSRSRFYDNMLRRGLAYTKQRQADAVKEGDLREEVRKYVQEMKQVKEEE